MKNSPKSPYDFSFLFKAVDNASLVFFRIAFGAILLWEVWRYFQHERIQHYFMYPEFTFKYYGFTWLSPWPGDGMLWHFYLLGLSAALVMIGLCYRLAAVVLFSTFTYVFLLDQSLYLNHFYLVSLFCFLIIFLPLNQSCSLDAWFRPEIRSSTAPAWVLWLLRFQVAIPYFFGGIAKLNEDWLQGEPLRMWLGGRDHYAVIGTYFNEEWMVYFFSYGGLLFDLLVVPCLLSRRLRPLAFSLALFFHLTNAWVFNIGIFPWMMIAATTLFFDPDWPRRFLFRRFPSPPSKAAYPVRGSIVLCLAIYSLLQVLVPLRHFLYPGSVHWTEEGHRFAWHMKLRDKKGWAFFHLYQPETGEYLFIDPREELTPRQAGKMATRPDMILQYAHHLAQKFQKQSGKQWKVYVDSLASLNGRPPQKLINPEADLASKERNLWHADWILPLMAPPEGLNLLEPKALEEAAENE